VPRMRFVFAEHIFIIFLPQRRGDAENILGKVFFQ
jgi:hypothetical protein